MLGNTTVACRCQDCKYVSEEKFTADGFGICQRPGGIVLILPGENGPMCESYVSRDEDTEAGK